MHGEGQPSMTDEIHIRECREDESQAVLDLWRQAGDVVASPTDSLEQVRVAINHSAALFLVADSKGQMVGTIIGTFDGWRGEVYDWRSPPKSAAVAWPACWWMPPRNGWGSKAATGSPPWWKRTIPGPPAFGTRPATSFTKA